MKPDPCDHAATRDPLGGGTGRTRLRLLVGALALAVGATGFLTAGPAQAASSADFYVSPDGAGSACSAQQPCSLTGAQDQVRQVDQNMQHDIVVQVAGGTYNLSRPLTFTAADSGSNGHQVHWQAAPGAQPVLSGGKTIAGWSLSDAANNIWSASVPADLTTRQLYVDGVRADVSRSSGGLPSGSSVTSTGYTVPGNSLQSVRNPSDLELWYHPLNWVQETCNAASITGTATQTTVTMKQPCWDTVQSFYGGSERADLPQYLANDYSLLTQPGKWYLDSAAHRIYYIPRAGQNMATATVIAPTLENLVTGAGTETAPVHDLTFQGLTFAYATWLQPSGNEGFAESQANLMLTSRDASYNWSPGSFVTPTGGQTWNNTPYGSQAQLMPDAVEFHAARNVSFVRNTFTHLGAAGLGLDQGSQHNSVVGNVMTDISGNGLQVGSVATPNQTDPNLVDSYNTVSDNYVHAVNAEFLGGVGMFFGYVANTTISHNEIADLPYSGMSIGWGWGSLDTTPSIDQNNAVTDNYIHDVMQQLNDGGGIYALGPQPGGLMSGNYIKNVVHDSGHIYLDQGSTGWTMTNNVATGGTTWLRHNPNSFDPASNFVPHEYTDLNYASTATTKITGLSYVPTGELPASIINAAGLEPAFKDLHLVTPTGDTQAPTAPKQLKATITNPTAVNFSWFGSADNVVVTGYEVHVNDALALVTVTPGATLTGLVPGRPTTLTVYARDLAGNLSNPASITVKLPPADTQPPTAPGTPTISAPYPTTVHLSWSASTDNWAVTQYLVYRDGTLAATTTGTATDVYGATPGQAAQYTVKAEDAMGNISAAGPAVSATTPNMPNLAYHVPAQALFLDGSTAAMQANSVPGYAVDGDLSTYVQATNQYAWQLQIDLGASHDISSVVTTMPSDKFATEYKIEVSADGQNWTVGDDVTGFMGGVSTQNFANPASGRYLRIVAVKPDGGGQTGGQMAISELAVYGS